MASPSDAPNYSPFTGGPLFRFERAHRVGWGPPLGRPVLVRAVVAVLISWVPMLVLAWLQSLHQPGAVQAFLSDRHLQAQALFATPILLAAEPYTHARLAGAIPGLLRRGILQPAQLPALEQRLGPLIRLRDAPSATVVALLVSYAAVIARVASRSAPPGAPLHLPLSLAGIWYAAFALPLFLCLLLLWLWRFALWSGLLFQISRLPLALVPTHADRTGGLRWLTKCQASFAPVVFAIGTIVATYQIERTPSGGSELVVLAKGQLVFALLMLILLHLPLAAFSGPLLRAKREADEDFSSAVARHNRAFEQRWFAERDPAQLLGDPDPSSQIDLSSAYEVAGKMWWLPVSFRPALAICAAAVAGLVPRLIAEGKLLEILLHLGERLL